MTLKDFIKTSLVNIVDAVAEAQTEIGRNSSKGGVGAFMTYSESEIGSDGQTIRTKSEAIQGGPIRDVEFDVLVTVSKKEAGGASGQGKLGGEILMVAAKVEGEIRREYERMDSSAQRIKFSVPVFYNGTPVPVHAEKTEFRRVPQPERQKVAVDDHNYL